MAEYFHRLSAALVGFALVICSSPARAADGDTPVAAPFSWTGFYIGASAGRGSIKDSFALSNAPGKAPNGLFLLPEDQAAINAAGTGMLSVSNLVGGLQAGFNQQFSALVLGGEVDFQSLRATASTTARFQHTFAPVVGPGGVTTTTLDADWLVTARLRAGIAIDRLHLYGTAGYAHTTASVAQSQNWSTAFFGPATGSYRSSDMHGYVYGGGVEYAFAGSWSVRAEYLRANLFDLNVFGTATTTGNIIQVLHLKSHLDIDVTRAAINYRF